MAVKMRLKRMGAKKKPFYRIIVADSRSPRDGRFIATVGTYDPRKDDNKITLKEEDIISWLNKGAQPTDTVKSILSNEGVWAKYKASKTPKKKKEVKKEAPKKTTTKSTTAKKTATKKTTTTKKTTKKESK